MSLQQFKTINDLAGWLVFFIAAVVYTLTMESTVSLWDCGEFITSASMLQVVHPPGAPLFLMIGRMFSFLAMGDASLVALSLNFMSAISSGFAMLFLFWITSHLARRMLVARDDTEIPFDKVVAIIGAAFIAGLTGTFLDSVWFSAVEGEVYSMSLLCTSIVVWAMLKWEERADEPYADRWLLFIAFLMGCSIFVHWLNLLTIPALSLIYYFRRHNATLPGAFVALGVSILILGFFLKFIITGLVDIAAWLELTLVNSMGLPFNSGVVLFMILLFAGLISGLWFTKKNNMPLVHNGLIGFMFILIGYSTITTTVIRSNAGPNIDMNSPRDVISLASYLKREQYGSRPFLTGYYYTSPVSDVVEIGKKYQRGSDKYDIVGEKIDYEYKGKKIFFPRIYDSAHKARYERGLGLKKGQKPSYADNLRFFFDYQIGHMYVRYFMWNFVGRQNDEQGLWGSRKEGNWVSGINEIDGMRLGDQKNLPAHITDTPNRNTFYFIPLLLGLLGLVFHFTNDKRRATVVLLLFLFSGVAIIIQGNSPPVEPRERDYIFAASFYAFAIWVGLGVIALYDIFKSKISGEPAALAATAIAFIAPLLMGFQGWDDHDRSGRFAARDFAANYLNSCAPNSIIFTQGDNDTYPLWYAQEVEGIRRDVRVVNLSLLGVDWYINQLRREVNDAIEVPMSMQAKDIRGTKRDIVYFKENPNIAPPGSHLELSNVLEFVKSDNLSTKLQGEVDYYPTRSLKITVNKENLRKQNAVAPEAAADVVNELKWTLNKKSLYKNDLMVLDIIAANNWKVPIYFAISVSPESYLGLEKYFQLEGLAYRLMPIQVVPPVDPLTGRPDRTQRGQVNPDVMYENLMNKFRFGNIDEEGIHVDTDLRRMIVNFRGNYARLANALSARGDKEKAIEVLDRSQELMPDHASPYDFYMFTTIDAYYQAGAYEKANELTELVATRLVDELEYVKTLSKKDQKAWEQELQLNEYFIRKFQVTAEEKGQRKFADKLEQMLRGVK